MQTADTNILLRALVHDASAPEQCVAAAEWLAGLEAVYVPQLVQAELVWWMRDADALTRADVGVVMRGLLGHPSVHLQARDAFEFALEHFDQGGDFADALITFEAARVSAPLVTFDKKLARRHGVSLLRIQPAR